MWPGAVVGPQVGGGHAMWPQGRCFIRASALCRASDRFVRTPLSWAVPGAQAHLLQLQKEDKALSASVKRLAASIASAGYSVGQVEEEAFDDVLQVQAGVARLARWALGYS